MNCYGCDKEITQLSPLKMVVTPITREDNVVRLSEQVIIIVCNACKDMTLQELWDKVINHDILVISVLYIR